MLDVGEDGGLPNVQGGENLGEPVQAAQQKVPSPEDVAIAVAAIRFLRPDEAVVAFRLEGIPIQIDQEGRAILSDGRWRVSRVTVTDLLDMAGVPHPPPPEPTDESA